MINSFSQDGVNPTQDQGLAQSGQVLRPGLYVVATPIGNLRDITLRALDVLQAADAIYCEDTRVTQKLLSAYGISKDLFRCDEHTEERRVREIADAIKSDKIIALVCDAGTPGVSDPGAQLLTGLQSHDVEVFTIPGPSAAAAAYSLSGWGTHILFLGFLPTRSAARRQILQRYRTIPAAIMMFEAPQRVMDMLEDIDAVLGARRVLIAREMTKRHERVYRGTPRELIPYTQEKDFKGEIVMMIAPSDDDAPEWTDEKIDQALEDAMKNKPLKQAVADITAQTGMPRKVIYARALDLQGKDD